MGQALGILDDGSVVHAKSPSAKISIAITALMGGVANLTALTALPVASLSDGAHVWVDSVRDYYALHTTTAGVWRNRFVASAAANRKWCRLGIPDPSWTVQTVWEINTSAGNDEADGLTQGTALRTWEELEQRLGLLQGAYVNQFVTVWTSGDFALNDPIRGRLQLGPAGCFTVKPRLSTPLFTGVVTAKDDLNFSTGSGQCSTVTSSWTPATYISAAGDGDAFIVKDVTNNRWAWIAKDLGGGKAKMSPWHPAASETGGASNILATGNTTIGATIEVYRLPRVNCIRWMTEGGQRGFFASTFNFYNFDTGNATIARSVATGCAMYYQQCRTRVLTGGGQHVMGNCCIAEPIGPGEAPGFIVLNGGLVLNSIAVNVAQFAHATWDLQAHVLFQGCIMTAGRGAYVRIRNVFFEDCTVPCLQGESGATFGISSTTICGNGNTDAIVQLKAGSKFQLSTTDMVTQVKAATSGSPIKFNTNTTAPAFDPATGTYTAPRNLTLANIDATVAAGGFGGQVLDPITGCFVGKGY